MIDFFLEKEVILYNQSRLKAFKNGVEFIHNDSYDHIINARYCKISRIKKRLIYLLAYRSKHYFLTFTFNDNYINKSDRTKRDLIKKCLESFSSDILYILNVDYGSKTEREHYHCIVGTNNDDNMKDFLLLNYPCFSYCQHIRLFKDDIKRVSKYINKLSNHCVKDSTKNKRIVYNFKGFDDMNKREAFYDICKLKHKLGL